MPLRVRDLCLRFDGVAALDHFSMELGPSGCTAILGPNGAGKSLLLRCLHGVIRPDAGLVDWNGRKAEDVTARQGMVLQRPVLLRRSVLANVEFVLRARGLDVAQAPALLDRIGLLPKARQPARHLSGGEAQRLALARALALRPEVLILDEPTASLDPGATLLIERIVAEAARAGTRVILVTHDMGQARRLADDVVFLHRGRAVEHASAVTFFRRPRSQVACDHLNGHLVP
jgi:tungstate transport system ATP-binding protein